MPNSVANEPPTSGPMTFAASQSCLHNAQAHAQLFHRHQAGSNRQARTPQAGSKALQHTHTEHLLRRSYYATQKVRQSQACTRTHRHHLFAARISHFTPDRRHDTANQKGYGKNRAVPHFYIVCAHSQFVHQIHRQKRNKHGIACSHQYDISREDSQNKLPVFHKIHLKIKQ